MGTDIVADLTDLGVDPQVADELAGTYPHDYVRTKMRKLLGRSLTDPGRFLAKILKQDAAQSRARPQRPGQASTQSAFDPSALLPADPGAVEKAQSLAALHFPNTESTRAIVVANFACALRDGATESEVVTRFGSIRARAAKCLLEARGE